MSIISVTEHCLPTIIRNDSFHATTLTLFLQKFDFSLDSLDVALRRLLMAAKLPTETQQIDRVMEAFAKRFNECHPELFCDPGMRSS